MLGKKYGLIEAEREHLLKYAKSPPDIDSGELDGTYYKNVLYGHLAYLKMVRGENDEIYIKLCLEMVELDPDVPKKMQQLIADYENYDVFICHASEDKEDVARPLAEGLISRGYSVWYDEFTLVVGDSLLGSISRGLAQSRFGVVVISPNFFAKKWPQNELAGLVAREVQGTKVILPVWHKITAKEVLKHSPILADRFSISWDKGLDQVLENLEEAINPSKLP